MEQTDGDYILVRVTPREGRVSRNAHCFIGVSEDTVTPREGRVSRNEDNDILQIEKACHAPRGACE